MTITLTPGLKAWLSAQVGRGAFSSIEEGARQLIDERIAEIASMEGDDMAWAQPFVDEARTAVARGETVTIEEHRSRNAKRLSALRK